MAGLTPEGFTPKTTAELIQELGDDVQTQLGNVNVQADSILGVILAVVAARLGSLWDLGLALYRAFDPDTSTGDALVGLAALTGTTPRAAAPSTVDAAVDLDAGVTLPAGSRVHVADAPARVFQTDTPVEPSDFRQWHRATLTAVEDGPTVADTGTLTEIQTPVAGWNAITNEPVPATRWSSEQEPFGLEDAQALVLKVNGGPEQTATFETADFEDISAATADEVAAVISADIDGVTAVAESGRVKITTNLEGADATLEVVSVTASALGFAIGETAGVDGGAARLGRHEETEAELRARRGNDLERQGTSTSDSLRAQLLALTGVLDASVYQNRTDQTDENGLPPKSFRAVVWGPEADTNEIARTVFANSPLGIEGKGDQSAVVLDSQETEVTVRWDDATEVPIYIAAEINAVKKDYAGDDVVTQALLDYVNGLRMGDDVISEAAKARLFQAGVYDVPSWAIDTASPPVGSSNISIGLDEAPTLALENIDLTVHFVLPS